MGRHSALRFRTWEPSATLPSFIPMRWQGRRESGNIEDRRGMDGGLGGGMGRIPIGFPTGGRTTGGGIGIVGLIIVLGIAWLAGVNPIDVLTGGGGTGGFITDERTGQTGTPSDDQGHFVAAVLGD